MLLVAPVPLLVAAAERVTADPATTDVGLTAPTVRFGAAAAETVTAVHAEQLLLSFDSAMAPVLSAQTRTYQVPAVGNVYESVAAPVPEAASAPLVCVPISVLPVPDASVARWNRLVKPAPVAADPLLEMVEESVTAVPLVAAVGVTEPATKSLVPVTVTVA